MKRYFGGASVVLGMLAAALTGCGDESSENTGETKSAITSRGFAASGCGGAGIFDINSNNFINYVALDNSSFSNVNAQLYTLNQNNQQQLVTSQAMTNQIDQAMTSMFDQVSNFTSAYQMANQLAAQQAYSQNNSLSNSYVQGSDVASTATTTNAARNVWSSNFARNDASGFNNVWSSNDANNWVNSAQNANAWNSANSALNSGALNSATRAANSAANTGAFTDASSSLNSAASNGAVGVGTAWNQAFNGSKGGAGIGFGKGGFGFFDMSNLNTFSNSQFNNVWANRFNNSRTGLASSQYANLIDNQLSAVNNNAYANSFNNVNSASRANSFNNVHNDARSSDAYNTSNTINNVAASANAISTYNQATTANQFARNTTAAANNLVGSNSLISSQNVANQAAASQASNYAANQALSQRYSAFNNLSSLQANHLILQLNVTAQSQNAIVRVFTGNNATNVASNQNFAQNFGGCGFGVIGAKGVVGVAPVPIIAPAEGAELVDSVAVKPEE